MQALNSCLGPTDAAPARAARRTRQWHVRASLRDLPFDDLDVKLPKPRRRKGKELALHIYHPKHFINWDRWEVRMLQILEKREKEEGALGKDDEEEDEPQPEPSTSSAWQSHFHQYDNPAVHQARLSDSLYMGAWASAIAALGPTHIKGKVVVDVGCGLGVLSLMCAKAGAKKVISIDGSSATIEVIKQVATANGYGSVIETVCGRVQDLRLREKADVIVADWPGPALMSGGMLQAVAYARREMLKPGGLVLPSHADLYITGLEDRSSLADTKKGWEDVAGFDLTPAMTQVVQTPRVAPVARASQLCTSTALLAHWDLGPEGRVTPAVARRGLQAPGAPFQLQCLRDERLFGLVLHFDLAWAATAAAGDTAAASEGQANGAKVAGGVYDAGVKFTTDPRAPPTTFQQVVLNFPRSIRVQKGDVLEGKVVLTPSGLVGADLDINVQVSYGGVEAGVDYRLVHSVPLSAYAALNQTN